MFFSSERARDVPRQGFLAREAGNQMGSIAESLSLCLSVCLSVCLELNKFPVGVPRGTPLRSRAPLVGIGTDHAHTLPFMHERH